MEFRAVSLMAKHFAQCQALGFISHLMGNPLLLRETVSIDWQRRLRARMKDISFFSVLVKQLSSSEIVLTRRVEIQIEQTTITLLPGHIWEVQVMYLLQTIVLGDQ